MYPGVKPREITALETGLVMRIKELEGEKAELLAALDSVVVDVATRAFEDEFKAARAILAKYQVPA